MSWNTKLVHGLRVQRQPEAVPPGVTLGPTIRDTMRIHRVSEYKASQWHQSLGPVRRGVKGLPVPPAEDLRGRIQELSIKFNVSSGTVNRWRKIRGISGHNYHHRTSL